MPLLSLSCFGQATLVYVICGLSDAVIQEENQRQPANRSGLPENTLLHLLL